MSRDNPRIPPIGMHRAAVIRGLRGAAAEVGLDYRDLLQQNGLDRDVLDDHDRLIRYSVTCRILQAAASQSGCEHFGLLVGRRSGLESLGIVDRLARASDTAGEALSRVVEHLNITSGVSMLWLSESGSRAVLRYALCAPTSMPTLQYYDAAMAIAWNMLRDMCGPRWVPAEIRLSHRSPGNPRPYRSFFRAPLRFDSPEYAITFDRAWLRRKMPAADASRRDRLVEQVNRLRREMVGDTTALTRRLMCKLLALKRCSIEDVAIQLGVHRRTLDRHLDAEGTSFSAELGSVRRQLARELLVDTDLNIGQVADALSYASVSSFCTAFHRWQGTTASEFRAQHQADPTCKSTTH